MSAHSIFKVSSSVSSARKAEEVKIHWHPYPLSPIPPKQPVAVSENMTQLTDEVLINSKLECMGAQIFEKCFTLAEGGEGSEGTEANKNQKNLWQCNVCKECFILCKPCVLESERLRNQMMQDSKERLQAEEVVLPYLDLF